MRADQRVLVVRGVAGHDQRVDAEAGEREEEQHAGVDVGDHQAGRVRPPISRSGPKGMTTIGGEAPGGARGPAPAGRAACPPPSGVTSSLKMNLRASASGWNRPSGPTRFGPGRSWMSALPRRSTQTMIGATLSSRTRPSRPSWRRVTASVEAHRAPPQPPIAAARPTAPAPPARRAATPVAGSVVPGRAPAKAGTLAPPGGRRPGRRRAAPSVGIEARRAGRRAPRPPARTCAGGGKARGEALHPPLDVDEGAVLLGVRARPAAPRPPPARAACRPSRGRPGTAPGAAARRPPGRAPRRRSRCRRRPARAQSRGAVAVEQVARRRCRPSPRRQPGELGAAPVGRRARGR